MTQTPTFPIEDQIPSEPTDNEPWGILRSINPLHDDFLLVESTCSIGRSYENDILLEDAKISKIHCKITRASVGQYMIQDFSSNGTYIDDDKIGKGQSRRLHPGDKIYLLFYAKVPKVEIRGYVFCLLEKELLQLKSIVKTESRVWGKLASFNIVLDSVSMVDNSYSFGRDIKNNVCIPDIKISSVHCKFFRDEKGQIFVEDHSSNGTFVGDELIGKGNRKKIVSGDRIYFLHYRKIAIEETMGFIFTEVVEPPSYPKRRRGEEPIEEEKVSKEFDNQTKKQLKQEIVRQKFSIQDGNRDNEIGRAHGLNSSH